MIKEKEEASATYQAATERDERASLLEQHTTDVFSTSFGNIGTGEKVKVEIEYIMELKHDAEVDGLRFTIPTSVAPRYGVVPSGLGSTIPVVEDGMKISVEVSMPSDITLVQVRNVQLPLYIISNIFSVTLPPGIRLPRQTLLQGQTQQCLQPQIRTRSTRTNIYHPLCRLRPPNKMCISLPLRHP
jgi:hypothetical protein